MLIVFFTVSAAAIILYFLSKNKYDELLEPLERKSYPLKQLLPVSFYILDAFQYRYHTKYDRKLLVKITELYGAKYAYYYLQVHWANKLTVLLLVLLLLLLTGISTGVDIGYGVFSLLALGVVFYVTDDELNRKIKKRQTLIRLDFPDFLNKLTLLINAGMTISRAWEKIVADNKKERPLYDELGAVLTDIKGGKSEIRAYEDFAKRCRTPEITKFISVIVQNLKKGNAELVSVLRVQSNDCWEMRKNVAKKLGEEASTKMLLPMMIMFVAILLIVATPAILAMQGF